MTRRPGRLDHLRGRIRGVVVQHDDLRHALESAQRRQGGPDPLGSSRAGTRTLIVSVDVLLRGLTQVTQIDEAQGRRRCGAHGASLRPASARRSPSPPGQQSGQPENGHPQPADEGHAGPIEEHGVGDDPADPHPAVQQQRYTEGTLLAW